MLIIVGLIVLVAATTIGVIGVLTNAGAAHLLTDQFAVLGYDVSGSTGTVFLYGIVVGAVAGVGLSVLLTGARRAVNRGRDARHQLQTRDQHAAPLDHRPDTQSTANLHVGAGTKAPLKVGAPSKADVTITGDEQRGPVGRWWHQLNERRHQPPRAKPTSKTATNQ